jgi:eukaryotic-like serine/threonine-protein kinase
MSTSIIEPGTRLANRYRLEDRVSESGGSTLWKAIDEILARPVAIRTFEPDFADVGEVVTAARAASRLTDPRLTQVFDADDSGERAYVVSEWVVGDTLEDLLQHGPMEPERAAALVAEAAEAIAAAHQAGLGHLRLTPGNLVWTTGGTVKVTGLAVEAALARVNARRGGHAPPGPDGASAGRSAGPAAGAAAGAEPDPPTEDTRGLGRLLYAAVTAHWPGGGPAAAGPRHGHGHGGGSPAPAVQLPAAPRTGEMVCAPRQVLAGVPYLLDSVVCRALGIQNRAGPPFATPAEFAAALDQVPRTPLPLFMGMRPTSTPTAPPRPARTAALPASPPRRTDRRTDRTPPQPQTSVQGQAPAPPAPSAPSRRQYGAGRPGSTAPRHRADGQINKPLVGLAALVAVAVVAIGGWQLSRLGGGDGAPPSPTASPSAGAQGGVLRASQVSGFDPAPGDGDEKSERADLAIDSKAGTAWTTEGYNSARFGRLKSGVGLLLDMGKDVRVANVKVTLPAPTGSALQLRAGDEPTLSGLRSVGRATDTNGTITFRLSSPIQGRYLLLWFTKLAPDGNGQFRGKIGDVVIHGPAG